MHGLWSVWVREAGRLCGVCRGAESVRTHMGHSDGLTGRSGSCRSSRGGHVLATNAADEPTPDLVGGTLLAAREGARTGDECPRTVIIWSLVLEQHEDVLCAVGRPAGDNSTVCCTQRLR